MQGAEKALIKRAAQILPSKVVEKQEWFSKIAMYGTSRGKNPITTQVHARPSLLIKHVSYCLQRKMHWSKRAAASAAGLEPRNSQFNFGI
eukprot:1137807-Pelagomonas_calceolata.AAC.7